MSNKKSYRLPLALTVLCTFGVFGHCVDEQTLECELAVARIEECCPDFDGTGLICDADAACGTNPALDINEAECVSNLSCATIQSEGGCDNPENLTCVSTFN